MVSHISRVPFAQGYHNISTVKNLCKPQNYALIFLLRFFLAPSLMQIQHQTYSFISQHLGQGGGSDFALLMGTWDTERSKGFSFLKILWGSLLNTATECRVFPSYSSHWPIPLVTSLASVPRSSVSHLFWPMPVAGTSAPSQCVMLIGMASSCRCHIRCLCIRCPFPSLPCHPHSQLCISCWQTHAHGRVMGNRRHWECYLDGNYTRYIQSFL